MADTKQKLIEAAHQLFYRNGFQAVGIDQILSDVGVTKTTFYNHFTSKDDLILAVLDHHDQWWCRTFQELLRKRGGLHPRHQLNAVCEVLNEIFHEDDFRGCIFVNAAVEFPLPHQAAFQSAQRHKKAMESIVQELAAACGASDPKSFAEEFTMVLEGAFVTQHVLRTPETAKIAHRLITLIMNKYMPPSTTASTAPRPSPFR
ncbi:MAG TPA: TetR/AcrR family transcriptional regulator [Planctomycetota bacterium]|nr:TetR/AcrR family transcriptional regulator [Planctomycetota bacterium]